MRWSFEWSKKHNSVDSLQPLRPLLRPLVAFVLSQRTGCWGFQKFPVICGLATTRLDGMKLLQGRPEGTFLLRLSESQPGALAVIYVKPMQEVSPRKGQPTQQRSRLGM